MTEYAIIGLLLAVMAWFIYRSAVLEKRVGALEAAITEGGAADPAELQESVAEMIEELKVAADSACEKVTQKMNTLNSAPVRKAAEPTPKSPEREQNDRFVEPATKPTTSERVPVGLISELADEGLSTVEIARQAGVGQAEVELTLRFHPGKRRVLTALRRIEQSQRSGKEVA
jgi:hypothetical protein